MTDSHAVSLNLKGCTYTTPDGAFTLGPLDLQVRAGGHCVILGSNGCGKSTLLALMAGLITPRSGSVHIGSQSLATLRPRERARRIALMPQEAATPETARVWEIVQAGRFGHQSLWPFDSEADEQATRNALELADATHLADRTMGHLSAGERQRALLARALAQETKILLLDEPGSHLDLARQVELHALLRHLRKVRELTLVTVSHEINLATADADQAVLMRSGQILAAGSLQDVLTEELLGETYGVPMQQVHILGSGKPLFHPRMGNQVNPLGDKPDQS